jgi:hypothetical protein
MRDTLRFGSGVECQHAHTEAEKPFAVDLGRPNEPIAELPGTV